ncbi:hypothetical protein H696_02856 [Fonticula alba]|uniref:Uncharacterized protein n=1 Tax=Fonticula alba TaxID=691883 RepID=A0A058ZAQ2_FONAL|nr:hypothetical protein H696_02856 [Fonticula alba]KCV70507.1 hypothetical protein H696_02856 [Fonticula alba]|eukprot:XP_009495023.1 hypothetical protein H696_02856 [Fonticula alba]
MPSLATIGAILVPSSLLMGFAASTMSFTAWNMICPLLFSAFGLPVFQSLFVSVMLDVFNGLTLTIIYGMNGKVVLTQVRRGPHPDCRPAGHGERLGRSGAQRIAHWSATKATPRITGLGKDVEVHAIGRLQARGRRTAQPHAQFTSRLGKWAGFGWDLIVAVGGRGRPRPRSQKPPFREEEDVIRVKQRMPGTRALAG